MAQDVNDIQAALEAAAMAEAASSTEAAKATEAVETSTEETHESEEAQAPKGNKAQDRIRELVGVRDGLQDQLDNIQGTVTERDAEIGKLVDLLQMREGDSQTLEQIRSLYGDERYKPMIETIDKALKGDHEEEEAVAPSGKEGEVDQTSAVKGLLQQAKAELESEIQDQHAELLLHKADLLTDKYIAELPDTYNESDKNVLKTVLVDHINWNDIEETPDKLPTAFAEGFQSALDWYGSPKGTAPEASEEKTTTEESPALTEESINAHIEGKDYAKMSTIKTPDGTEVQVPELSEADFSTELAQMMKAANYISRR